MIIAASGDRIDLDLSALSSAPLGQALPCALAQSSDLACPGSADADGEGEPSVESDDAQPMEIDLPIALLDEPLDGRVPSASDRARLNLCVSDDQARATRAAAKAAGLPLGAFVAGLVAGVPLLMGGGASADHLRALTHSSSELATLSRKVRQLVVLLRQGSVGEAQEYRALLDTIDSDVRAHLRLASVVLVGLRPRRSPATKRVQNRLPMARRSSR